MAAVDSQRAVNEDAAEEWQSQSENGVLERSAEWIGGTARSAQRRMSRGLTRAARATGLAAPRRSRKSARPGGAKRRRARA